MEAGKSCTFEKYIKKARISPSNLNYKLYHTGGFLVSRKSKEISINLQTMSVNIPVENEKVLIAVIDGKRGIARVTEAVEHGMTTVETVNGQSKRFHYDEKEMF